MTGPGRVKAAVIIPVHRDDVQRHLEACYASLMGQTYPQALTTVFIASNGVTAESRQRIADFAPAARVIDCGHNRGWTGGTNAVLPVALAEDFDHFVMLNADTVLDPEWLRQLVEAAQAKPDVHIFQSKILIHGTAAVNSLGNRLHYLGFGYCGGYGAAADTAASRDEPDYASGAAMLVKREVFEAIGLFREDYFAYHDDVEFCWRARLAGYNIGLAERSVCYHKYRLQKPPHLLFYLQRNRLLTLLTLQKPGTLLLIAPCLLVTEIVLTLYFLACGLGGIQWRLLRHFLRPSTWRSIRAHRRIIRRLRRRRDAEIVRAFDGAIRFAGLNQPLLRYVLNPLLMAYWAVSRRFIVW